MTDKPEARKVSFSYWSDPLCIWAFVGQAKLERLLTDMGDRLEVRYAVVPVFGSISWRFREGDWSERGVEGKMETIREVAKNHGFDVSGEVWKDDPPASSWGPGAAIKAVDLLERRGAVPAGTEARYQVRIRERFFLDNENIARRKVQLSLAEELDIPREALTQHLDDGSALALLWEEEHEKDELRVRGSPTYVFDGGRTMIFGNFDYRVLSATAHQFQMNADTGSSVCV